MNNTQLAIMDGAQLDVIQRTGKLLAASGYFDGKGVSEQAIAMMATKIMAGREMGFGPFASVNGIHIISGKPSVGANLMAAAVKGSSRYDYRVKEMSNDRCVIEFFEREGDKKVSVGISEFTKEDAVKAGTQNMNKFARNMLFARALSNGVRWHCPDVFAGNAVYVPEELGAEVDSDGNVIESTYVVSNQAQAQDADNPFETNVDADLREQFESLGSLLYGEQWGTVSRRNVQRVTAGQTDNASDMKAEQMQMLVDGMLKIKDKRMAETKVLA